MSAIRSLELINFESSEKSENSLRSVNLACSENSKHTSSDKLALREASAMRLWLRTDNLNTSRAYKRALADFLASAGAENIRAACASRESGESAILAYTAALAPYAASTQNQRLSAIAKLLQLCEAEGVIPEKVSHLVLRPRVDWEVPELEELPSPALVHYMLAAEKDVRNRVLLALLYLTGCRCSEAAGLCWQDIRRRGIGLQLKILGKGGKTRRVMIENEWLIIELAKLRRSAAIRGTATGLEQERPRVTCSENSQPMDDDRVFSLSPSQISRICHAAWARAGVNADKRRGSSAHLLRHCHATHVRMAGGSAEELQRSLGHRREETTAMYGAADAAGSGRALRLPW